MTAALDKTAPAARATTEDAFLDGRVMAHQPQTGYRAGLDAVFLAASIDARAGECALELGVGAGIASLCLLKRVSGMTVSGIEVQRELCGLARENAEHNGLSGRLNVIEADLAIGRTGLEAKGLEPDSFDHVLANPPYFDPADMRPPPDPGRAQAHVLGAADLACWVKAMVTFAAPKASITLIHRACALGELLALLECRAGGAVVQPLHPTNDKPASRVIIRTVKGSRAPLKVLPGFVLHDTDGAFTPAAAAVLRDGAALMLA